MEKVLVAAPIYEGMEYCLDEFLAGLKGIDYENFDILLVDNTRTRDFYEKLKKQEGIGVIRDDTYAVENIERLVSSRNKILDYAQENGYDYLLMMDSDVIPKPDILKVLLDFEVDVVSGIYFNYFRFGEEVVYLPVAYVSITDKEFEDLKSKGQLPVGAKSSEDIRRHLNKQDVEGEDIIEARVPSGGCLLLSRKAFCSGARYGLEESAKGATSDEIMFFNQLRGKGFKFYCSPKAYCQHRIQKKYEKVDRHL